MALSVFADGIVLFASQLNDHVNYLNVLAGGTSLEGMANYFVSAGATAGNDPTTTLTGASTNIGWSIVPKGTGFIRINNRLTIGPTNSGDTIWRRLTITYAGAFTGAGGAQVRIGGNLSGSLSGNSPGQGMALVVDADTVSAASGMSLFYTGHNVSSGAVGGRTSHEVLMNIISDVTLGTNTYYAAGGRTAVATGAFGGRHALAAGDLFGANDRVVIRPASGGSPGAGMSVNSVIGYELGIDTYNGTQALWKIGQQIVWEKYSGSRGALQDHMLAFAGQVNISVGAKNGIVFGAANGQWPFNSDSTIITSQRTDLGGRVYTALDGIDFAGVTFTRAALRTQNAELDGSGNFGALVTAGATLQTRSSIVAKTAVVATVAVGQPGTFTVAPALTIDAPGGAGVTATAVVTNMTVRRVANMNSAGTGYTVGDLLTDGGVGVGTKAMFKVVRVVAASGAITDLQPIAAHFTASISGGIMTVTAIPYGSLAVGMIVGGTGVTSGCSITSFGTGAGGTGTYNVTWSDTVASSTLTATTINFTSGDYTTLSGSASALTGGTGAGATATYYWGILAVSVTGAGTLYSQYPPPKVSAVGGFEPAKLYATMSATQVVLQLNNGLLNVTGIPTSSAGLSAGDVWSNAGILTVV